MHKRLAEYVSDAFMPHPPKAMGVAVSGGGDSMAMLHLLREFSKIHHIELHAVTVDHQLRPEAAEEARRVAQHCAKLGVSHETLVWKDWEGRGNLQQAARDARYAKISKWALFKDIDTVAMGHTADDQAETVLMRLSRRSGVDGLTGMQKRVMRHGVTWVRPLLRTRRDVLRAYLVQERVDWHEDPSNEDISFDRIKMRQALEVLAPLGIDAQSLTDVAQQMAEARKALEWHSFIAAKEVVTFQQGAIVFDERGMRVLPDEIQRRLFSKAIQWISGGKHGPRRDALFNIMSALKEGQAGTAEGCHVRRISGAIWVFRELNAVRAVQAAPEGLWDNRWVLTPPEGAPGADDLQVRVLGENGIEQCPDWRSSGLPHPVVLASPSVWQGDRLVSAPLAGYAQNWHAGLEKEDEAFFAALLTH
jgi:tRNA(Ile)-lysidine synthase